MPDDLLTAYRDHLAKEPGVPSENEPEAMQEVTAAAYRAWDRETEPDFKAQNMQRQRACMYVGLCQVCGEPVPWPDRLLVYADTSTEVITIGGQPMVAVTEPWLCGPCADYALGTCPALIRRRRGEQLSLIHVTGPKGMTCVVSQGWVDGHLERESKRLLPAMWVKLVIHPTVSADAELVTA